MVSSTEGVGGFSGVVLDSSFVLRSKRFNDVVVFWNVRGAVVRGGVTCQDEVVLSVARTNAIVNIVNLILIEGISVREAVSGQYMVKSVAPSAPKFVLSFSLSSTTWNLSIDVL